MPRGIKKATISDVTGIIEKFTSGMSADLKKLYQMGFEAGAVSERQRVASLLTGGTAIKADRKSTPHQEAAGSTPKAEKKPRKNPWADYTPEQREARLATLKAAREKAHAARKGGDNVAPHDTHPQAEPQPEPVAAS